MGLRLRRPTDAELDDLLRDCARGDLTYGPTGGSLVGSVPAGMHHHRWEVGLTSPSTFDGAVKALQGWKVHLGAGLSVRTDGPLAVGTNVALSAPLPVGYVDAACRIVAVVDEDDRFGFAYGTLATHPERGEESFIVHRRPLRFIVEAVSKPVHPLARLAPPVANRLQASAIGRYLRAMQTASA